MKRERCSMCLYLKLYGIAYRSRYRYLCTECKRRMGLYQFYKPETTGDKSLTARNEQ